MLPCSRILFEIEAGLHTPLDRSQALVMIKDQVSIQKMTCHLSFLESNSVNETMGGRRDKSSVLSPLVSQEPRSFVTWLRTIAH